MTTATRTETDTPQETGLVDTYMRNELREDGYDLPELADTMEEADARATASTYLFALRGIKRDVDANDAEFTVLQDFNRTRHVARQTGLIRQMDYLRGAIKTLFGFMTVTGKKKSLNLVAGRVGMRAKQDELVVVDEGEVIDWANANGLDGLVRTKLVVDRKALRIWMEKMEPNTDPDFTPPPGVRLEVRPDEFFATPAND